MDFFFPFSGQIPKPRGIGKGAYAVVLYLLPNGEMEAQVSNSALSTRGQGPNP